MRGRQYLQQERQATGRREASEREFWRGGDPLGQGGRSSDGGRIDDCTRRSGVRAQPEFGLRLSRRRVAEEVGDRRGRSPGVRPGGVGDTYEHRWSPLSNIGRDRHIGSRTPKAVRPNYQSPWPPYGIEQRGNITASTGMVTHVFEMLDEGTRKDEHAALAKAFTTDRMLKPATPTRAPAR